MLSEKRQTKKGVCSVQFPSYKLLENANQSAVRGSTSGLAWEPGCAGRRQKEGVTRGVRKHLGEISAFIILIPVMVSQVYKYVKNFFNCTS